MPSAFRRGLCDLSRSKESVVTAKEHKERKEEDPSAAICELVRDELKEMGNTNTTEMMCLCDLVRETAYAIHAYHGNGYLEKVYENALANRLRRAGLTIRQRHPIIVYDEDGSEIGDYYADILVNDGLLVELKACKTLTSEHQSQLLHYLKATGVEHGLLINFGSYRFEIKKFVRTPDPVFTGKEHQQLKEAE